MTGNPIFGHGDRGHLGEAAAALVDGVLSHHSRDLALAHIAHCDTCRTEVEQQRALKSRLSALGGSRLDVPTSLVASLINIGQEPAPASQLPPPAMAPRFAPPVYLPRRRLTLAAAAGFGIAASAGALVALGSAENEPGRPVQPQLATLLNQHAATSGEVPITDPGFTAVTVGLVAAP